MLILQIIVNPTGIIVNPPGIKESVLRELIQAAADVSVRVIGKENAFHVIVSVPSGEKPLVTARGDIRLFASLDTAASFIGDVGILRFDVDISHYRRGRLRAPRPDRAEALKRTRTKLKQQPLAWMGEIR